jgi:hypothetical protein
VKETFVYPYPKGTVSEEPLMESRGLTPTHERVEGSPGGLKEE